ncbi:major facilitator superfamily domain-containing protein [Scheffersomyces coipomensis]|uniref:major facilitator superfamily domain-containing protein n=1 Tax=Scheffersomyces coipomensis TaxID=1788519 RepID=UPI00315D79CE
MSDLTKDTETTVLIEEHDIESCSRISEYDSCESILDPHGEVELIPDTKVFSTVPNFYWIEVTLLINVFLSGFDGTVTASTYTVIGNEFNAANLASWITTSYLITSTSFQPLYGSFSDVIGRRKCCFFASGTFALGCLGCSLANNITILNLSRALTGVGGGGLITLSTIVNSDIIIPKKRGLFQAVQNLLWGFGAVRGASFGGLIASTIGWRWCFILQIPPSILAVYVGYKYIRNQPEFDTSNHKLSSLVLQKIDFAGSFVLVLSLTCQLFVLTLGGNELEWSDYRLILLGIVGVSLMVYFVYIEIHTKANPIIPVKRFKSSFTVLLMGQNFLLGLSSYAYLFALPLLFQLVLGDSTAKAGLRLAIPSLATPIGGIITGVMMNKYEVLKVLVYSGTFIMATGNFLSMLVGPGMSGWLLSLLLMPSNLGQGMAYPSSLFTFIFAYGTEHQATSTSTIYLSRSVGGVFGVTSVSVIVQAYLKYKLTDDLSDLTDLKKHQIHKIVKAITRSTDAIYELSPEIQKFVLQDYESAIRLAQLFFSVCCGLAFVLCILRDVLGSKPNIC